MSDVTANHQAAEHKAAVSGIEFNDLTDEQKARVMACKTAEELVALAEAEGVELSDEQLDGIAGGDSFWCPSATSCPNFTLLR